MKVMELVVDVIHSGFPGGAGSTQARVSRTSEYSLAPLKLKDLCLNL